ncbi:hypothetical protein EG327_009020 [Venturia inaequalis]|uniref:Uncharacterized protein n=1 Tax=Venturia inaequalis TaxID=5025 RepID=A0A8H3YU64_VENIN|nr:hypothetical protein EG327_009020 [Venturia inaequalis]
MSEDNTPPEKKKVLRKIHNEYETKRNVSVHNLVDADRHEQALAIQRAEEAASSATDPSNDEEERASSSDEIEPGMKPEDQHPVAMGQGDDEIVSPSDVTQSWGDVAVAAGELEGAAEGRPGFPYKTRPTFIQGGNIIRKRPQELVLDSHSQQPDVVDGRWDPETPDGSWRGSPPTAARAWGDQSGRDSGSDDYDMRMAKAESKRDYDEMKARQWKVEAPQDGGNASKSHKEPARALPQQPRTSRPGISTLGSRAFDPYYPESEPDNFADMKKWVMAQMEMQLKDHTAGFPVRVHLVGTDDEHHEIIGVHQDMTIKELNQTIYESLEIAEWVSLTLDVRWMSDADWKFICDSTPSTISEADSKEDGFDILRQSAWEGNRHTPITPLNCAHVLAMLKMRKGKDFISVTVMLRDGSEDEGQGEEQGEFGEMVDHVTESALAHIEEAFMEPEEFRRKHLRRKVPTNYYEYIGSDRN